MRTITDIKAQKGRGRRANIFLDGSFAFSLENRVIEEQHLASGQVLSDAQVKTLAGADLFAKCLNSAFRLLNYRPRSEAELCSRLQKKYDRKTVERVISHLRKSHLIDDNAFTVFWVENRRALSPRGKRLLGLELRYKGVAPEVIAEVINGIDDEASAYQAALRKGRTLKNETHESFKRKLGAFLNRRGFSWEIINAVVVRVWQEIH